MSKTYRVVVTREDDNWLADVPDLPGAHTYAKTLAGLDRYVREVIALVEDLPDGAEADLNLAIEIHTGDPHLDEATARLRAARELLARQERELAEATERMVKELRPAWSVRDAAALLGVSMQRVSQIAPDQRRPAGKARRRRLENA